ncbi:MAG: tetratricopeptide repeat protein [Proteobacteria bacterium]|nr:tetratricopeptide repeat protein [Pseudomonadota bacterium]
MIRDRLLAVFCVTAIAAAVGQAAPARAADDYAECDKAARQEAITACTRAISSRRYAGDRLSNIYNSRAIAWKQVGDLDRAIADYSEAIRLNAKNVYAYYNRGISRSQKGDQDGAIADYGAAIRVDAKFSRAYNNRGVIFGDRAQFDRAIEDYSEAIRLNPKYFEAYNNRGVAWRNKGDSDRAIADESEAIRIKPDYATAYNSRGVAWAQKGDHDRAIKDYGESIRLEPDSTLAITNRAYALEKKQRYAEALADFRRVLALAPDNREIPNDIKRIDQKTAPRLPTPSATTSVANAAVNPTVRPAPPGSALAALPSAAPSSAANAPKAGGSLRRVALVIGNGAYANAPVLPNPANDAADMAAALRRLGFDVVEGRDLDRRGMEAQIRAFSRKIDQADLALFFYAGHGLQVTGKNYLVPIDAKLEREGDLSFEAIDVSVVLAQMENASRANLVFLDACRNNPLARSLARSLGVRSAAVGSGLASIQSGIGTMIVYATQPDNVALDGTGRNSPFTTALLKHLPERGVDVGLMMRRVRADVIEATRQKQVPWDHSSLIGEIVLAQ